MGDDGATPELASEANSVCSEDGKDGEGGGRRREGGLLKRRTKREEADDYDGFNSWWEREEQSENETLKQNFLPFGISWDKGSAKCSLMDAGTQLLEDSHLIRNFLHKWKNFMIGNLNVYYREMKVKGVD